MSIWVVAAAGVVLVAALILAWRKYWTPDARELRRLRAKERQPDTYGAAEGRRNMMMTPMPGKHTHPGGP